MIKSLYIFIVRKKKTLTLHRFFGCMSQVVFYDFTLHFIFTFNADMTQRESIVEY